MPDRPAENERIHELVRMGRGDEDDRLVSGDAVGGARVDFAEEEVDDDAEAPEAEVVDHVVEPGTGARHVGWRGEEPLAEMWGD